MSASIDFSEIREMTIAFSGLSHMDNEYTFFYDETNNSRLFRITETDFNVSKDEDFVLGGLVYEGKHKAFDMEKLLQSLRLQPTMKEVKRKHIAPGNSFLCFLTDNENLMLMDGYESLYIKPIYMFPNMQTYLHYQKSKKKWHHYLHSKKRISLC